MLFMPSGLTSKELTCIEEQLGAEEVLVKKYKTFSSFLTDPQLKNKCVQIAERHQKHFNTLMSYLV